MQTPYLIARDAKQGLEAWILWDETAEVFELFSDPECRGYIGHADTRTDARAVARDWFADRDAY